jgi:hypothetical protein
VICQANCLSPHDSAFVVDDADSLAAPVIAACICTCGGRRKCYTQTGVLRRRRHEGGGGRER